MQSGLFFEGKGVASLLFFMPMCNDLDRRPEKTVRFPELIFQVAQIGKMEQFRIIDMQDKSRWVHPDLGTVVNFQLVPGMGGSGMRILSLP